MEDVLVPIFIFLTLFIGLPWIILHYVSKWKTAATLTTADENLLDDLYDLSRRLEERMMTVERIVQADNPNWRALAADAADLRLDHDRSARLIEESRRRLGEESRTRFADDTRSNQPLRRNG